MAWTYSGYLNTRHWRRIRLGALTRADYHCERCGFHGNDATLNVHHKRYRLWHEDPDDLEVLCAPCHRVIHAKTRLTRS